MNTCPIFGIDAEAKIHYLDLYRKAEGEVDYVDWALVRQTIEERSIPCPITGCWHWYEGAAIKGYGVLKFGGRQWYATRLALLAFTGELPEGRYACHKCDVPSCVNPDHLFWGSVAENAQDASRKGRGGRYPQIETSWGKEGRVPLRIRSFREELTVEKLRGILHYDPNSGIFRWHENPARRLDWNRKHAGKRAGSQLPVGYRYINILGKLHLEHRLAWLYVHGEWPVAQIDHIDGNRQNNSFANLREATNRENAANRGTYETNKSGFKGVSWDKQKRKWYAKITVNYRQINLGYHDTPEAASEAYERAAVEHFGEYAAKRTQVA